VVSEVVASAAVAEALADLVADRLEAAAPVEAGEEKFMAHDSKVDEQLLGEFVQKLRAAAGENLTSVVLYGSAAEGEFHPEYSDYNLLCLVGDTSFASLNRIAGAVEWWRKKKHHPPLVMTAKELKDTADVFSIEFIDMKQRHRVLYGDDALRDLHVPMHLHRSQLEYELREKLFLLRQHIVLAGSDDKALWEAMLNSLSSFTTLFRHVLIELGEVGRKHSREAVQELASRLNFDAAVFVQLMDIRAHTSERKQFRADNVATRYLAAIEKVAGAVDTMQSSPARS
jgi:Nucleotidyltransferase domain